MHYAKDIHFVMHIMRNFLKTKLVIGQTYDSELLLDFNKASVYLFGLFKQVQPLLLDTLHFLDLLLWDCYVVHGQCTISLLDVLVLYLHIKRHKTNVCYHSQHKLQIF